ncbi:MAG TPA: restriction endonuclease subunit S [Candidatus Hydrogenedentes bacterium]|nr:restriction endonuclease subunit S [Candidatus Hydrogenedentota bacterium]
MKIWQKSKLKYVARFAYGDTLPPDRESSGEVPVYGSNGPYAVHSISNTAAPALVIGRKGSYGKVNWSSTACFASDTTFYVDETVTQHELRWIYWLLQTLRLDEGSDEAAVPGLNRESAYEMTVSVPSIPEQRAIADYLDRETGRLDALVGAKERWLDLLAEKRRALITQAVTRGLNPNAPLRDSGIPWLGQIPKHWETERARWLFRERDERSETGDEELLTVSHLTGVTPRSEKDVNMFEAETTEGYKICHKNDLVINTLWAWMGAMGVSPVHGIVSPAYNVYSPCGRFDPRYVDALVRIPDFAKEATRYSKGVWSSRLRLYPEGLYEIMMPVPPLSEQQAIVAHIERETGRLDALRSAAERTIALLRERRAALISEAVCGRIDMVRMDEIV